jgi:hypothetical protein
MVVGVFMKTIESLTDFLVGIFVTSYYSICGKIGDCSDRSAVSLAFSNFGKTGGEI